MRSVVALACLALALAGAPRSARAHASPLVVDTASFDFGDQLVGTTGAAITVTVTNTGAGAAQITSLDVLGPFVVGGIQLPASVASLGTATFTIAFAPTAPGAAMGQVSVASDQAGTPPTVDLTGNGTAPSLAIAPTRLDFGTIAVGGSGQQSITVANRGDADLTVSGVVFGGANAGDFSTGAGFPITLAPGASQDLPLDFTPSAMGARSGTATLQSDDTQAAATVTLVGTGSAPGISVQPGSLDFGSVTLGATATLHLYVSNVGAAPLTVTGATLSGTDSAKFLVDDSALPATVPARGNLTIDVSFTPDRVGGFNARLALTSDDQAHPEIDVAVTGQGTTPVIRVSPSQLDFGPQLVGQSSLSRSVSVTNGGSVTLSIASVTLGGADASAFALLNLPDGGITLAPGASSSVDVVFAPTAAAPAHATLDFASNDAFHATASVALDGLGVTTPLVVLPSSVDFGALEPGGYASRVVTLANASSEPIALADPAVDGAQAGAFGVTLGPRSLDGNQSVSVPIVWSAPQAGDYAATVHFTSSDGSIAPATLSLTGTARVAVDFSPSLDFGDVPVGQPTTRLLLVTNRGTRYLAVTALASSSPDFTVPDAAHVPPIAPSTTAAIPVVWRPTALGAASTALMVTVSSGETARTTVMATGNGIAPTRAAGGCAVGGAAPGGGPTSLLALLVLALALGRRR